MMENDDLLYEYVIDELEEDSLIKGLWAKAIAHSEGNNDKAKSLYIQYRVQSIKDEFNSFGINYTELEKDKLFSIIKSGFKITEETNQIKVEQEKKIKASKKLNEEKINNEKYGKIGGWLIFYAVLLVLWNLSLLGFIEYFTEEYISAIKNMYLAGNEKMAQSFNYIFYSELFTSFMLFLFTLSFFSKDRNTRIVAIYFFVTLFIARSFQLAQLINIFNEINKIPFMEIVKITASLLWLFIFSLYFIFSKRVKKTFINETKIESLILISVIIPIILFFYYANNLKVIKNDISLTKTENIIKETNNASQNKLQNDDAKMSFENQEPKKIEAENKYIENNNNSLQEIFEYKDWNYESFNNLFIIKTYGKVMAIGHVFGIFKQKEQCNNNFLWLSLSTTNDISSYIGENINFRITIDDEVFYQELSISKVSRINSPPLNVVNFSNILLYDHIISLLKKGRKLKIEIIETNKLYDMFDNKFEEFSLDGFVANFLKLEEKCNIKSTNQKKIKESIEIQNNKGVAFINANLTELITKA